MNTNGNHEMSKSSNALISSVQPSVAQYEHMEIDNEEMNTESHEKRKRFPRMRRSRSLNDINIVRMFKICNRLKFKRKLKQPFHRMTSTSTTNQKKTMKQDTLESFCKTFEDLTIKTVEFSDDYTNSSPHLASMHANTNNAQSTTTTS